MPPKIVKAVMDGAGMESGASPSMDEKSSQVLDMLDTVHMRHNARRQPPNLQTLLEAMQAHPFVYDAIMTIANTASRIPVDVIERPSPQTDKQKIRTFKQWMDLWNDDNVRASRFYKSYVKQAGGDFVDDHPILNLLYDPPKVDESLSLIQKLFVHLESAGNAYWEIVWKDDRREEIEFFYPVTPSNVWILPDVDGDQLKAGYVVHVGGQRLPIDTQDMVHFKYPHPTDEYYGLPPLAPMLIELFSDINAMRWNRNLFENFAIPEGLLSFPDEVDDEVIRDLREYWERHHKGPENTRRTAILDQGANYQPMSHSPKDMEFLNLREWIRDEIAGVFNIPPMYLKDFAEASFSNASAQIQQFYWQGVMPKLGMAEQVINGTILPIVAPNENVEIRFNFNSVEALQENMEQRAETALNLRRAGVKDNEIRRILFPFLDELDGDEGDILYRPFNLVPVNAEAPEGSVPSGTQPDERNQNALE